jgi:hypothetical protein
MKPEPVRGHIDPNKRREEEEIRKKKKIRGNVEPVEEMVHGQTGRETFEYK